MRKLLLLFVLNGCAAVVTAQNLLPNPGFQQKTMCPSGVGDFNVVANWNKYTNTTPDYHNDCAPAGGVSIPSNFVGYQAHATGGTDKAYAGMFTHLPGATPVFKEYLHTRIVALTPGQKYEMSMYVSLADSAGNGADGLGVHFFVAGDSFVNNGDPILITPKVSYDTVITNITGWTKLTKQFTADSAYTHVVIGCFKHDTAQNLAKIGNPATAWSYYYIDDVELRLVPFGSVRPQSLLSDVKLYPNPSTGMLNVTLPQSMSGDASLTVYNVVGQKLFEAAAGPGNNTVQLPADMASGMYMVEIKTEAGMRMMPLALQR